MNLKRGAGSVFVTETVAVSHCVNASVLMKQQAHWMALFGIVACSDHAGIAPRAQIVGSATGGAGVVATSGTPVATAAKTLSEAGRPSAGAVSTTAGAGGMNVAGAGVDSGRGSTAAGAPVEVGGMSGAASDGGSTSRAATEVVPSVGCALRSPRPSNGAIVKSDRIYTFPEAYDGMTPAPLLLALHAAGNPNTQLQKLTEGSRLETELVRAFPKSAGNAWVYNTDVAQIDDVLGELVAEYCIDERRIFATGHSSGAQMIVQMLCKGEQRFRAVAPVAASKYCDELAPISVLYIQGQMDAQRGGGNGEDVVRVFRRSNTCADSSVSVTSVRSCPSVFDRKEVAPGCVSYAGCSAPTLWCSHNDNGYNNSDGRQHGWPCFASEAIADFFLAF